MTDSVFQANITEYLNHIQTDYSRWVTQGPVHATMVNRFNQSVTVDRGTKYAKIVVNGSAHSFIVLKDDGKFKAGDILKAASWASPARNFTRGNILTKKWATITWTGCL